MEVIKVTEFYGNDYCNERLAYYYGPGKLDYIKTESKLEEGKENERTKRTSRTAN